MVLYYAKGGSFHNWMKLSRDWYDDMQTLEFIISGLGKIHEKMMVHRDFHTGNILCKNESIIDYSFKILISDMGLCGEVDNIDKSKICGVMPYVAPKVLRGEFYTQASDIYSFGMIMYFVATRRQPFADRAHDQNLALSICNGIRP